MNKEIFLSQNISALKGIGSVKAEAFSRLGLDTFGDALHYFPKRYEDRNIKPLDTLDFSAANAVLLKVHTAPKVNLASPYQIIKFTALEIREEDFAPTENYINIVFFNAPYLANKFKAGGVYSFFGKITHNLTDYEMVNPKFELYRKEHKKLFPIYKKNKDISQNDIANVIKTISEQLRLQKINLEFLPDSLKTEYGLPDRNYAATQIHTPEDEKELDQCIIGG